MGFNSRTGAALAVVSLVALGEASAQALPDAIAAPGEKAVMTVYAEGAQVYECKADTAGKLIWSFREPEIGRASCRERV